MRTVRDWVRVKLEEVDLEWITMLCLAGIAVAGAVIVVVMVLLMDGRS